MTGDGQEESLPAVTVKEPQVCVEALGLRALRDETAPGEQATDLAHEAGELRGKEATDQQGLDSEQDQHR